MSVQSLVRLAIKAGLDNVDAEGIEEVLQGAEKGLSDDDLIELDRADPHTEESVSSEEERKAPGMRTDFLCL